MSRLGVLLLAGSVALAAPGRAARGQDGGGCDAASVITGCGTAAGAEFRGVIIVPGSDAANRAVAASGGCEGCVWFFVIDCDRNRPDGWPLVNCNAARCPDGTTYRIYLQRPGHAAPGYVDSVCITPARRVVTAAELHADVERYLTSLRPPPARIAVQPDGRSVVGIPTYFVAQGARTDRTTLDVTTGAGAATLLIDVAARRYAWEFGDGARCETAAPGAPYGGGEPAERCDDQVAHVYRRAAAPTVRLRATWHGTYSFDVGFGPVGPLPIPGDGVPGPVATRVVEVRPARAQLVGG